MKEKELQDLLVESFQNNIFSELITNADYYVNNRKKADYSNYLPDMSIDEILCNKYRDGITSFLSELEYDIRLISGDSIKNI